MKTFLHQVREVVQRCIKRTKKHNPELKIKSEVFNDQSNHVEQSSIMSQKSPHNEESFTINQSDADENDEGDVKPDNAELDSFLSSKIPTHVEVDGDNTSNDATEKFVPTQDGISDASDVIGTQNRRRGRPKQLTSSNAEKLPDRKRKYTRDVSSELEFECALCGDNFCSTKQLQTTWFHVIRHRKRSALARNVTRLLCRRATCVNTRSEFTSQM